jgi:hypothetical protein
VQSPMNSLMLVMSPLMYRSSVKTTRLLELFANYLLLITYRYFLAGSLRLLVARYFLQAALS